MNSLSTWQYLNNEMNPVGEKQSDDLKSLYHLLNTKHRIETLERFKVEGLPEEISQDLIERVLYYRFKGALFYVASLEKYFFLPFTLSGEKSNIDSYGRYNEITPVLFTGHWNDGDKDVPFISGMSFKVAYDKTLPKDENYAFILTDHSLAVSQDDIPMNSLIHPVIDQLKDILVLVNIDLVTSAKVMYVRVNNEDEKELIEREFHGLDKKILSGQRVVAIVGNMAWQELQAKSPKDSSRYFQTYQSFDNLRKDLIGISNGGTFMKQEHITDQETKLNSNSGTAVLNNALRMRTEWADLVNHYTDLNIVYSLQESNENEMIAEEGEHSKNQKGEGENDALSE